MRRPTAARLLNPGDAGLLRSLDGLSAADASRSVQGGATIAVHAQHLRYGLSLMNRWAIEAGNPFADARWDEAWKTSVVGDALWAEIRAGLRAETQQWLTALRTAREVDRIAMTGIRAFASSSAGRAGAYSQRACPRGR